MESSLWNLIVRISSAVSLLLLAGGAALVASNYYGLSTNTSASFATVTFAAGLSAFSLVALNFAYARGHSELQLAADIAHQLSQGKPYCGDAETELIDALRRTGFYLREKAEIANRLSAGELPGDLTPVSDSDLLGIAMRDLAAYLALVNSIRNSSEDLQRSVMKLLGEVSGVASGDLTVEADAEPGITGEIAAAFNAMTGNLRALIGKVKSVSLRVGSSADAISDATLQLAHGSVSQTSQIERTRQAVEKLAAEIVGVADSAENSASIADGSLESAHSGVAAARENINAMNSIRRQVNETAKRIKRLGERVQEIGQIVTQIEDLSDKTSLIALNASLQASSGAGDKGFSAVAVDIERLAERCSSLTQQISTMTQTVNLELTEAAASMDETIAEVIAGSAQAEKAGRSLAQIEDVTSRLCGLVRSISDSSEQQRRNSEEISAAMSSISNVTQMIEAESRRAADSVSTLVDLAGQLKGAVSPFKLPMDKPPLIRGSARTGAFVN